MATEPHEDLTDLTRTWISGDPDPSTRTELQAILESGDAAELRERMGAVLEFGTAGLRGRVEAGSNRMNRATVIRTTRGVADYLLGTSPATVGAVIVGRDARLSSETFMEDTVGVLAAAGFDVVYFAEPTPTPIVAYTARVLSAVAAIVITASHNPPADNGYKVFASNAAQIIPPVDGDIARSIAAVGPAVEVPRVEDPYSDSRVSPAPVDIRDRYLFEVGKALPRVTGDRTFSIVYTPLHGVGGSWVVGALEQFGFRRVHPVAKQWEPDGRFSTVSFPNPEEPGALDLAHELASAVDADLVIANDPDTDRLAVSLPDPGGAWRSLTGNQIGSLLGDFLLAHTSEALPIVINSIVSSPHLGEIARLHGARFESSLTGFKWIWNAALALEAEGAGSFVFGYEEALGYSVGGIVRDKDGISAAVAFAALVAVESAAGRSIWDRLADLAVRDGLWVSTQKSIVRGGSDGAASIALAMGKISLTSPGTIGGYTVAGTVDYMKGADDRPMWLGPTPLVELDFGDAGRALVRPSGTEPKLKIYVDLHRDFAQGSDWFGAHAELRSEAAGIADDLGRWLGL